MRGLGLQLHRHLRGSSKGIEGTHLDCRERLGGCCGWNGGGENRRQRARVAEERCEQSREGGRH